MKASNLKPEISAIYRFIKRIIPLISWLCIHTVSAQETNPLNKPLKVGDKVPDLVFKKMLNYDDVTAKLSDFKGKPIILDFWATWCTPCVAALPNLMRIGEQYKDELKIILVSDDDEKSLVKFYRNNPLYLPTAFVSKNDAINRLFPHVTIPHSIWINSDQTVYAITSGLQATDKQIENFLTDGSKMEMEEKDDSLRLKKTEGMVIDSIEVNSMFNFKSISLDSNILYQSVISKYDSRISQGGSFTRKGYKNRFLSFNNYSIAHLFLTAYFGFTRGNSNWDKIFIAINDSTLMYPSSSKQQTFMNWQQNYSYSYRLVFPKSRANKENLYRKMQNDLIDFFNIRAELANRVVECLVLKTTDTLKVNELKTKGGNSNIYHSIFKISLKNEPVSALMDILNKYGINNSRNYHRPKLEILDETGIRNNIDLELVFSNMKNLDELREKLKSVGLEIVKIKKVRNLLVLSNPS